MEAHTAMETGSNNTCKLFSLLFTEDTEGIIEIIRIVGELADKSILHADPSLLSKLEVATSKVDLSLFKIVCDGLGLEIFCIDNGVEIYREYKLDPHKARLFSNIFKKAYDGVGT